MTQGPVRKKTEDEGQGIEKEGIKVEGDQAKLLDTTGRGYKNDTPRVLMMTSSVPASKLERLDALQLNNPSCHHILFIKNPIQH